EGGIGFAQDEATAKFPEMPRAAIAAGVVDYVLPPSEIARELSRIGRHLSVLIPSPPAPEPVPVDEKLNLQQIFAQLRAVAGVDFSFYRTSTINRRIGRRMILNRVETLREYVELLRSSPGEVRGLYEDLLITVTHFFRDPETFRMLGERIFPR